MAERAVKVWYDRPGDFLDLDWSSGKVAVAACNPANDEIGIELHLTDSGQAVGLYIFGDLYSPGWRGAKARSSPRCSPTR